LSIISLYLFSVSASKLAKEFHRAQKNSDFFMIKPHIIFPRKNITNLIFETIAHNINALAGDVLGDVLGDVW